MELDAKAPGGPIETRWDKHRFDLKLVNPANKRKYTIIVVGTGLAGGSAAASSGRTGLQGQVLLLPGFARGGRTPSRRRAASTRPRTTTTTATASTACSTTR